MPAAEDAQPAPEGEPGDADRRSASGRDGDAVCEQLVVHPGQPGPGADRGPVTGHRDRVQPAEVEQQAGGRRPAREAVPARTYGKPNAVAAGESQRLGHVSTGPAARDRPRSDIVEPGLARSVRRLVLGRAGQEHIAVDRPRQLTDRHAAQATAATPFAPVVGSDLDQPEQPLTIVDVCRTCDCSGTTTDRRPAASTGAMIFALLVGLVAGTVLGGLRL